MRQRRLAAPPTKPRADATWSLGLLQKAVRMSQAIYGVIGEQIHRFQAFNEDGGKFGIELGAGPAISADFTIKLLNMSPLTCLDRAAFQQTRQLLIRHPYLGHAHSTTRTAPTRPPFLLVP